MGEVLPAVVGAAMALWAGVEANAHRPGTPWLARIITALIGAAGMLLVIGTALSRAPVVVESRAELVSQAPGELRLRVFGTKPELMASCRLLQVDAYVVTRDGLLVEVTLDFEDDPRRLNTRPTGPQNFGIWRLRYASDVQPVAAMAVAEHRCAWRWLTNRTRQPLWAAPQEPAP